MARIKRYYLDKRNGGGFVSLEAQCATVKELGGKSVYQADAHGMSNQPTVVCFNATDEVKESIAKCFDDGYLVSYHWKYRTREDCLNDIL